MWGFGTPGAAVTSTYDATPLSPTTVGADGVWRIALPAGPDAGGPHALAFTSGGVTLTINDILRGDVFVTGGQSNAVFSLLQAFNGTEEAASSSAFPTIRLFTADGTASNKTLTQFPGVQQRWSVASPSAFSAANFSYFSAVGWLFGKTLSLHLNGTVPIGLLAQSVGGTLIQQWSDSVALSGCPQGTNPSRPGEFDSDLWNSLVFPLGVGPLSLTGITWYQSESNIDTIGAGFGGAYYACQLPRTITSWRRILQSPSLPFFIVQLAAYTSKSGVDKNILPDMRAGQVVGAGAVPATYVSTAMDCGDPFSPWTDIHPRLKEPVGRRLGDLAAHVLYGADGYVWRSPAYGTSTIVGGAPTGSAAVRVFLNASTLVGGARVTNDAARGQACPPSYNASAFCSAFEVGFSDGSVVAAGADAAVVGADGQSLTITVPLPPTTAGAAGAGAAPPVPVWTSYAYAPWPVTSLYTDPGDLPVLPWNETVVSAEGGG